MLQTKGDSNKLNTIRTLGAPRQFIKHDTRAQQLMEVGINAKKIARMVKEMIEGPVRK